MEDKFKIHLFTSETTDSKGLLEECVWLNRFLTAGLDMLHLRKLSNGREDTEELLKSIDSRFRNRIVLHDYPELAMKYGCGFQFNSRNPIQSSSKVQDCNRFTDEQPGSLHDFSVRALSCHTLEECKIASGVDFVTLSPIFDSISKKEYKGNLDMAELKGKDLAGIIALGGVTLDNINLIKEIGFSGAALLGDIWNKVDGKQLFLKFLRMRNFPLQFITDGKDVADTVKQARKVMDGGGRWIQVRMKDADKVEVKEALQELYPYCEENGVTLLVDDHYDLTDFCHGVHLGQEDESVAAVRSLVSPEKIIGLTVNNMEQIHESMMALPDYYGVGPFRMTTTKKRLAPVLGVEGYRRLAPEIKRPFVAIGGIKPDDIPSRLDAGAAGIALSSCITRAENPSEETTKILNIIYGK